jgi:hypothetical protein
MPEVEKAPRPQPPRAAAPRIIPPHTSAKLAAAADAASATPAIALPPDFHDEALRWQRRRRIGFAVAAASFLGVIVLSTMRARTNGAVAAPPAQAAAVDSVAPLPEPNGDVARALPVAIDSLSGALAYYREIEEDHREGLVGCRVLDRAYELVGRARGAMDSARGQIPGQLHDADSIRVSMLGAEFTHVGQTYRRSGCGQLSQRAAGP